jgi:hypothetical protein
VTPPATRTLTDAVLAALVAAAAPKPVGDLTAPDTTGPYAVLERPPGPGLDPSLAGERTGWVRYRVRCVSSTPGTGRQEAEWLRDRLRAVMLDRSVPLTGDGWQVGGRRHDADGGAMWEGATVNYVDDYALWVDGS